MRATVCARKRFPLAQFSLAEVGQISLAVKTVAGDPPSLKEAGGHDVVDQIQGQLGFGLEWGVVGNSAFFPAFPLIRAEPALRKKEAAVEEGVSGGSGVGDKDAGLAVVDFRLCQ